MPKTPEEMAAAMTANIAEKTGKSLAAWVKIAKSAKLEKHGQIVALLKADHGLTHGYASMIAREVLQPAGTGPGPDELVDNQYAGKKAAMRPVYEKLAAAARKLGKNVDVSPRKTYVTLRSAKQFGLIKASTATRIDVGLILKGVKPAGRLEPSGSLGSMVTHRVRVESAADVDAELKKLLKQAYQAARA